MSNDVFHHAIPSVSKAMKVVHAVVVRKGSVPNCRDAAYRIDTYLTEYEVGMLGNDGVRRRKLIREALSLLQREQVLTIGKDGFVPGPCSPSEASSLEMMTGSPKKTERTPKPKRGERRNGRQVFAPTFSG